MSLRDRNPVTWVLAGLLVMSLGALLLVLGSARPVTDADSHHATGARWPTRTHEPGFFTAPERR